MGLLVGSIFSQLFSGLVGGKEQKRQNKEKSRERRKGGCIGSGDWRIRRETPTSPEGIDQTELGWR